jgi:hypothetical protein
MMRCQDRLGANAAEGSREGRFASSLSSLRSPTGRNASCLRRTKPSCCSSCPGVALTVETDRADSNGDEKVCPAACLRQLYW